jgi:excisionase family DNA binding protein
MTTRPAFSPSQLADRWKVSTTHIYGLIDSGELKAFKLGSLYRIKAEEVDRIEGVGIECASSSTKENGTSSGTTGLERAVRALELPIVQRQNAGSRTLRLKRLTKRSGTRLRSI